MTRSPVLLCGLALLAFGQWLPGVILCAVGGWAIGGEFAGRAGR